MSEEEQSVTSKIGQEDFVQELGNPIASFYNEKLEIKN